VVRRGGKQPEAETQSRTRVNSIRPTCLASLLANGEARSAKTSPLERDLPANVESGKHEGGWSGNVWKVEYLSNETCMDRTAERLPCRSQSRHSSDEVK